MAQGRKVAWESTATSQLPNLVMSTVCELENGPVEIVEFSQLQNGGSFHIVMGKFTISGTSMVCTSCFGNRIRAPSKMVQVGLFRPPSKIHGYLHLRVTPMNTIPRGSMYGIFTYIDP